MNTIKDFNGNKNWQYEELKEMLLTGHMLSTFTLAQKYKRTVKSISGVFCMWRLFLKDPTYENRCPSVRMIQLFKQILPFVNNELLVSEEKIHIDTTDVLTNEIRELEKKIEQLKVTIGKVIEIGVDIKTKEKLKSVSEELMTLRQFKEKAVNQNWATTIKEKMLGS